MNDELATLLDNPAFAFMAEVRANFGENYFMATESEESCWIMCECMDDTVRVTYLANRFGYSLGPIGDWFPMRIRVER